MSEFKGTKEKLIVSSPMGTFYYVDTETTNCGRVATCYSMKPEESKSNAILFSKSFEMFEMLERILKEGVIPHLDIAELIKEATQI